MAKRKIIRHLEFYGYPDQNAFAAAGIGSIDLSDIREKNREQDEELDNLGDEKVDKSDFNQLSGVVDTFVGLQTQFNDAILDKVNQHESAITAIHDWIEEFSDDISGYTEVDERLDNLESGMTQLSGTVEDVKNELGKKLDKDEADETYAKKEDTYTRDEIDEKLSGITEWDCESITECISGNGFMTKDDADGIYASKDDLSGITDNIKDLANLSERVDIISGNLDSFSATTNARMTNLETRYQTFETNVTRNVNTISATVESFESDLIDVKGDIRDLQDDLERKASKVELEELQRRIEDNETEIAKKVNKTDFDDYKIIVGDNFTDLEDRKADRSEISALTGDISGVTELINAEREAREASDAELSGMIDTVNGNIDGLREVDAGFRERIDALESGLTKEIADREQGDIDLIGSPDDAASDDTIWGAKKYAIYQRNLAVSSANTYTNSQIDALRTEVDGLEDHFDQELSRKANTDYVEELVAEVGQGIQDQIDNAVAGERLRAQGVENNLQSQIARVSSNVSEVRSGVTNLADRINAITTWDGVDPAEYTNEGNGVLDVLHREFHEFEKTHGLIKEVKVEDGNLIIVYFTEDGEAESVIPIGDIVDLDDYYTKEEVNTMLGSGFTEGFEDPGFKSVEEVMSDHSLVTAAALNDLDNRKLDASAYTPVDIDDFYTKEEVDGKVNENKGAIQELFDKLGYTNNETLVTNNEHEVAFGTYNVSNAGPESSEKTIFSIGNGTSEDDRKNAVELKENGDLYLWVEGEFMCVNALLGQLAHETYYDTGDGVYDDQPGGENP